MGRNFSVLSNIEANEAPLFRLREQDLQYKEKLKQFCALLEYLETFAPSSNVDVLQTYQAKLHEWMDLGLDISCQKCRASYLQGYKDAYKLFKTLEIIK